MATEKKAVKKAVKKVAKKEESNLSKAIELIEETNKRIDRIVAAISKAKSVKGL